MRSKKPKEKQYAIKVSATFIVCATSLNEAKEMIWSQLSGLNTSRVEIGEGQLLLPQIPDEEVENDPEEE